MRRSAEQKLKGSLYRDLNVFSTERKKKNRNEMKSKENKFIFQGIFRAEQRVWDGIGSDGATTMFVHDKKLTDSPPSVFTNWW